MFAAYKVSNVPFSVLSVFHLHLKSGLFGFDRTISIGFINHA